MELSFGIIFLSTKNRKDLKYNVFIVKIKLKKSVIVKNHLVKQGL